MTLITSADPPAGFWPERYLRYQRDCLAFGIPAWTFEEYKNYWKVFAREGELPARKTKAANPAAAPILVQRYTLQGEPRE
jgi:hypothetical protein